MAGKKTVVEIVDVIVIAIFLVIFIGFMQVFIPVLTGTPAFNTLGNLLLTLQEAYQGYDARYPLVLSEKNNYNLFGTEVYLMQFRNYDGIGDTVAAGKVKEACDLNTNCLCLVNVLNCVDTKCEDVSGQCKSSCDLRWGSSSDAERVDDTIRCFNPDDIFSICHKVTP